MGVDRTVMEPTTTVTVGVVAPVWLQEPLAVLLQAAPGVELWAYSATVRALLSWPAEDSPDLMLLYATGERAADQASRVEAAWPRVRSIVLVEHLRQREDLLKAGADEVLLHGAAPGRLMEVLDSLVEAEVRGEERGEGKTMKRHPE
jgi:DNA-binding NarL/FixJ family response regulator